VNPPPDVALALASAFLAGEWEPSRMTRRGRETMGGKRGWMVHLAHAVRREYPEPPLDRPRDLARFIAACSYYRRAEIRRREPWTVTRWTAEPVRMTAPRFGVPIIHDLKALAEWLGVAPNHLDWFADRCSWEATVADERLRHYHRSWIPKADGSGRLLEAPKRELKDLQRQVLHGILDRIPAHPAAHGFTRGRSALTGARLHTGREAVIRLDLESFFTAVSAGRVYGIVRTAGYPEPVAHALAGLCTTTTPASVRRLAPPVAPPGPTAPGAPQGAPPPAPPGPVDPGTGPAAAPTPAGRLERASPQAVGRRRRMLEALAMPHLPQGSPTSPALANLAAFGLDRRLAGLAARFAATYTRYADDLTFSGDRTLVRQAGRIIALVEDIAADEGFRVNEAKTRVRTRAQRQLVTGLVVNERPNVTRADYDRLRAVLHDAATNGPTAANRHGHPDFRAHLLGRIAWAAAANPARAARLHTTFAAIPW
jgi:RNA-directed DNA polymerase